ncbi:MAG: isoprenyl transferase [Thermodesulfobacteriota bacterium]|nr:MAG: isoprenyl transferase [Thermodesulfobacteriota bacterium]
MSNSSKIYLDPSKLPQHVAIIMDGNGRWAKSKGLPRIYGHKKGAEIAKRIIIKTRELEIPVLTLFSFSKENRLRPKDEVNFLFNLFKEYLKNELELMKKHGIQLRIIGDKEELPGDLYEVIKQAEKETSKCNKLILCIALNYSGRSEIVRATKLIAERVKNGDVNISDIDESLFKKFLYTSDLPDPDLLIRTSGEIRISNFLLYQLAYTEFYFTPVYWPDFTEQEYLKALYSYQQRERRFGKVYES